MSEPMTNERLGELRHMATLKIPWISRGDLRSALAEIDRLRAECQELRTALAATEEPMAAYRRIFRMHFCRKQKCDMPTPPDGKIVDTPMTYLMNRWPGTESEEEIRKAGEELS